MFVKLFQVNYSIKSKIFPSFILDKNKLQFGEFGKARSLMLIFCPFEVLFLMCAFKD